VETREWKEDSAGSVRREQESSSVRSETWVDVPAEVREAAGKGSSCRRTRRQEQSGVNPQGTGGLHAIRSPGPKLRRF
jgi:hypothetical protein